MFKKYKFKTASYKNALPVVLFSLMMVGPTHATSYSVHAGLQYDSNGKWPKVERKSLQGSFATSFKTFNVN